MKRCDTCNATYSDDFKFCPADATLLRVTSETVVATTDSQREAVPAIQPERSNTRVRKWVYAALAVSAVAVALVIFTSLRSAPSQDQEYSQPPVIDQTETTPKPTVRQRPVRRARAESNRTSEEPRDATSVVVEQARVQQLVASGYRQMQQRDYQGARESFEEALEIDPGSVAAQKGLKDAQTAESVEGITGVFRR